MRNGTEQWNGGSSIPTQPTQNPAEVIQLPMKADQEEAASAAKIVKWLTLADAVLGAGQLRKKA
jgi:hypothetical protein